MVAVAQYLPPEYLRRTDIAALPPEQVVLEPFERHDIDQILEQLVHDQAGPPTPSRFCMMGLVVVYCRNWRFSGNR